MADRCCPLIPSLKRRRRKGFDSAICGKKEEESIERKQRSIEVG